MTLINSQEVNKNQILVRYYMLEYRNGEITLDPWQRTDGWDEAKGTTPKEYKSCFISSLLDGKDIPKIYLYQTKEDDVKHILDGGHRTRAIKEFMDGEFSVKLNDGNHYYWELHDNLPLPRNCSGQNRVLPKELKRRLENMTLDIILYQNTSEKEARKIFNELNHHFPMTPAQVMNAHSSQLIDRFRSLDGSEYNGLSYMDFLKDYMSVKKVDMHEYMKHFAALFSLCNPLEGGQTFSYCEPKDALQYVRANGPTENDPDMPDTQYTHDEMAQIWPQFIESISRFQVLIDSIREEEGMEKWKPLTSEAYSLFQYINDDLSNVLPADFTTKIKDYIMQCNSYKIESSRYNKVLKKANKLSREMIDNARDDLESLKQSTDNSIIEWVESFSNNGAGVINMKKRHSILSSNIQV